MRTVPGHVFNLVQGEPAAERFLAIQRLPALKLWHAGRSTGQPY